ncbi:uncharacterized protein LOC135216960 isoform X2 [Macrobrachium nipponense]|uniref:uncharacterized protein LOC135216960 isoform X2 n=1 Tax=Macrobrachium nipponense TaxID=159736 RepID=UPI0030C83201
MPANQFGFHVILLITGTAICLAPRNIDETPAREEWAGEKNASLELWDSCLSEAGSKGASAFPRNGAEEQDTLPQNKILLPLISYGNAKLFTSLLRKPKINVMLNIRDHTLPTLMYLKNVSTGDSCTSFKELSINALKVVGDVIKSAVIKHRLLVMEKNLGGCFLQTLWHEWIAFEVLSEESWWVRINSLTYLSHSQHILVGSLDWIVSTMKKVKKLYNNSKINAMNTKWIWIPRVTSASQLTSNYLDTYDIIKEMQNIIVEGIRGVLIFEERKHSDANLRPERSQVKIGSIRAPGDGSWILDVAGIWHSGIYKMFLPLWPAPPFNFQNRTIRLTCLQKPQVFEFKEGGKLNETKGYVSELLLITRQHLNFTEILVPSDGFGLKEPNGSWNGMVGVLYRKEADIAPLDFSPSLSRSEVVEFGITIGEDLVILLSRAPSIIVKPFLLLQIFTLQALASIVAFALGLGITLGIFVKIESSFDQSFVQKLYLPQLIANCLKLFVYQGSDEWPIGNAGRIVTISGSLIVIVVASVYSGSITAFFAIPFRSKPIDSAEDLLASKIRPALRSKTNFYQTLLAENGILYPARDRARDFSGEEIASWDFLKTVADGTYALADVYSSAVGSANSFEKRGERCLFHLAKESLRTDTDVFAYQKNSPILFQFDYIMQQLQYFGIIQHIKKKYYTTACDVEKSSDGPQSVSVSQIQVTAYQ